MQRLHRRNQHLFRGTATIGAGAAEFVGFDKGDGFTGGCLLCNASMEMAVTDRQVKSEVKTTIRRLKIAIMDALEMQAQNQNQNQNQEQAAALVAFIVSAYFGTRVLAKADVPAAMIGDTRDHCLLLVP